MKLWKSHLNKKCAPNLLFFNEKKFRKIRMIFDIENSIWKSNFSTFWWGRKGRRSIQGYLYLERMTDFVRSFEWIGRRKFIVQPSRLYCTLSLKTTRSGHIHHAKYRLLISLFRRTKEELTAWRPDCSTRITWIVELICKDMQNRFTAEFDVNKFTYYILLSVGYSCYVHMKQEKYF